MGEAGDSLRQQFHYDADVWINYETEGDGATPVIFLHGFAAALTTWDDIRPLFPRDLFRLFFLDLKGFGFSAKPADGRYAPEEHAAILLSFMEALELRRTVLVGHSLGGGIALLTLLQAWSAGKGELVERLVLIDTPAYPQRLPRSMRWIAKPILGWLLLHLLPVRLMVLYTMRHIYHDNAAITSERINRYLNCFASKGIDRVFMATCRQLVPEKYAAMAPLYRDITIPVLIIWGQEDRIVSPAQGKQLHSDIPGSVLVMIADCGHNPHEERPAETYAVMAAFLQETL